MPLETDYPQTQGILRFPRPCPGRSETGNKSRHRFAVCAIQTRDSEKPGKVWVSLTGQLSLH